MSGGSLCVVQVEEAGKYMAAAVEGGVGEWEPSVYILRWGWYKVLSSLWKRVGARTPAEH